MHELTHAYQDYNLRKKGQTLYGEMSKDGYFEYSNFNTKNNLILGIKNLLYLLNYYEHSAFMSQIVGEMEQCKQKFKGVEQAMEYIKKLKLYRNYEKLEENVDFFISINDTKLQNIIVQIFHSQLNLRFSNYGKLRDWLRKRKYHSANKLASIIPKVAMKYLQVGHKIQQPSHDIEIGEGLTINEETLKEALKEVIKRYNELFG